MGKGVALEAARRWPRLPCWLGANVRISGNHVYRLSKEDGLWIVSFPTKEDWRNPSRIQLIEQSAHELFSLTAQQGWKQVCLPPPGCGLGGLKWKDVEAVLRPILDDRFIVLFKEK
jgi:hypothetical protein